MLISLFTSFNSHSGLQSIKAGTECQLHDFLINSRHPHEKYCFRNCTLRGITITVGPRIKFGLKVIGIRPIAPVLNTGPIKVSEHEMLSFSVRKEIIKHDNGLVVILLSEVVENEFLQTL